MFGRGRVRFRTHHAPLVWVLIEIVKPANTRIVTVYMHEHARKVYTKFECRKFSHTRGMNEYIASLGEGILIMVVEK